MVAVISVSSMLQLLLLLVRFFINRSTFLKLFQVSLRKTGTVRDYQHRLDALPVAKTTLLKQ